MIVVSLVSIRTTKLLLVELQTVALSDTCNVKAVSIVNASAVITAACTDAVWALLR
jgi:hypothetical protein